MDNGEIMQVIQTMGLPTALSIYLLISNNKQMEKYEALIERITGEISKLNESIKSTCLKKQLVLPKLLFSQTLVLPKLLSH